MTEQYTDNPLDELQQRFECERGGEAKFRLGMALAGSLSNQGKGDQAIAVLQQVQPLAPDDHARAQALILLGDIHGKQSDYEAAVADLEQAVVLLANQPDSLELLDVYLHIAANYWRQGYLERTRSFLDGAQLVMQLQRGSGPAVDRARADLLHVQAIVDGATGNQEGAIKGYREEIALLESLHDTVKLGSVYNNLSGLYKAQGRLALALDHQLKAMDIAEQAGEPLSIAISCNNLGEIYYELGCEDKALPYYRLYLDLSKKIANRMGEAFGHAGLARIAQSRGDFEKAEREFNTALAATREIKSRGKEAAVLAELADLYCDWGRPDRAAAALDESIRICLELQLFNTQRHQAINAKVLLLEAAALAEPERSVRLRKAEAILADLVKHPIAVENEEAVSATDLESGCHALLAQVLLALGDRAAAMQQITEAIKQIDVFTAQFSDDMKKSYLARERIKRIFELRDELRQHNPPV